MNERYLTSFEDQTTALGYTSGDTTLVSPQVSLVGADEVVYSKEKPLTPIRELEEICASETESRRRQTPGSNAFVPSVVGLIIAGEVVKDIIRG